MQRTQFLLCYLLYPAWKTTLTHACTDHQKCRHNVQSQAVYNNKYNIVYCSESFASNSRPTYINIITITLHSLHPRKDNKKIVFSLGVHTFDSETKRVYIYTSIIISFSMEVTPWSPELAFPQLWILSSVLWLS